MSQLIHLQPVYTEPNRRGPSMIITENIVRKKLKIKIASKCIDANRGSKTSEFGQPVFMNYKCGQSIPVNERKKSEINEVQNLVIPSSGGSRLYAADNLKVKFSAMVSHKRGLPGSWDGQMEKRRKMDSIATQQCSIILKQLMTDPSGWAFNQPVDPVELNIPDYFSIVSEPMDLGRIKTKLEKCTYSSVEEFAADVRLTFSNAMLYNPPATKVHSMAKELNNIFDTRWNILEEKFNHECTNGEPGHILCGSAGNTHNPGQNGHKISQVRISSLPKNQMSTEEKQKLKRQLLEVSRGKMPPHLQGFLKKNGFNCQREERTELDIDAFAEETLLELKRIIRNSLGARARKAEAAKPMNNGEQQGKRKIICKGTYGGNRSGLGSANVNPPTSKCGLCDSIRCQCSLQSDYAPASSSDLYSERSLVLEHLDASRRDSDKKGCSAFQMSKSDLNSDGAASRLDEHICSGPHLSTVAKTAVSGKGWIPVIDIQPSPKKALRAAMLKSRFADTILKAKQKLLLDHGDKAHPLKGQKEKERLERQQCEEMVRIEAQPRAAKASSQTREEALKMQRKREREAARLALEKMEMTVEMDDNLVILKDLEMLSGWPVSDCPCHHEVVRGPIEWGHIRNPLERLGLFLKVDEEVSFNGDDGEEVEIFS